MLHIYLTKIRTLNYLKLKVEDIQFYTFIRNDFFLSCVTINYSNHHENKRHLYHLTIAINLSALSMFLP